MNRIAGIFHFDNLSVQQAEIHRMLNVLKYGALDARSIWMEGEAGLGCTRDGDGSRQRDDLLLSHTSNEDCIITFDGRLDNRTELLATLRVQTQPSSGHMRISDGQLALEAYAKWELDCPKHLMGDFAFAIWDSKKHRLVCVRDHFGVKPFYYSLSKECFVFASSPLAILASEKIPAFIHEERIADLLMEFGGRGLEAVDKTSTFYRDVFRLPPAHLMVVQSDGMTLERYWELCPVVRSEWRTEQEYIEAFGELFREAVRCRIEDSPNPASMLSGGMDSSAMMAVGRELLAQQGKCLYALAVVSNSPDTNRETAHITSVLNQGDLRARLISDTDLNGWMDELVNAIELESEPFDCLMNLNRAVYLQAHKQGLYALLDGVDGDILLSDSGHLTQLWRQGAFRTIISETLKAGGLTAEYSMGRSLFFGSLISVFTPYAPAWMRGIYRQRQHDNVFANAASESIIDSEFAVHSKLDRRLAKLRGYRVLPPFTTQAEAHKSDLDHPNLSAGLERYERVASAFGIEARHPFTDVRLAEFCLGLPWQFKTRRGWTKYILRRAMQPYLPAEVVWRRDKDSLMWEVNRLILKARAEYFYQITCDEQASLKPYVDVKKLMTFWQAYLTRGDERHAELIWSGIALALWLRRQRELQAGWRKSAA